MLPCLRELLSAPHPPLGAVCGGGSPCNLRPSSFARTHHAPPPDASNFKNSCLGCEHGDLAHRLV
jgi:hypothetical protein